MTFTLRFPGFAPTMVTRDRNAIKQLFTSDPLTKREPDPSSQPSP
jgi:hypothetical protein